ncbi:MAG TPA: prepilin-type N-terminal cleavage/methylation domain-containing protein [Candidatus Polarisedimenticolia bacterium]|nr:prepilin-type N-terminal cleavage/methylation domain-containing protein [Candidatus Polarisedimenticolia bacterium]
MTRRRGGEGFTLPELLLALALLGLLITATSPALGAAMLRSRAQSAAREMTFTLARLRGEAISGHRIVGLRIATAGGTLRFTPYADGDGDGLLTADILNGVDPPLGPARDLPSRYEGVDFGLLDTAVPALPPGGAPLPPGSDPVRFGVSDIISFTPVGTASSGTLYVSDGRDTVYAVVLYGRTGRIRTYRYDRATGLWDD